MLRMAPPPNSITRKLAPSALIMPIRWRIRSFGADPLAERAPHLHPDGGRHFDVQHAAQRPYGGHFGGADAECEGAHGPMAGGMAVRAHHDVARAYIAHLRQDLVANAAFIAADIVELGDALRGHELADLLLVGGGLGGFRGHAVVEDDGDLGRDPRPWGPARCPRRYRGTG